MEQVTVEKTEWEDYFDNFNKRNHFRSVRLEVSDETGSHRTVKKMPLSGVTLDQNGIEILLEDKRCEDENHYTHFVKKPKYIIKGLSPDGQENALIIVDETGFITKLSFQNLQESQT